VSDQLSLDWLLRGLPLNPVELAELDISERTKLYTERAVAPEHRELLELAVRQITADRYRRAER